jgi:U1 small nuclear ribonucleoprotein
VSFLPALEEYKKTDVYHPTESWLQRRDRKKQEKIDAVEALKTEAPKTCETRPDSRNESIRDC